MHDEINGNDNESLAQAVGRTAAKTGKELLTSEEILILACGEIVRSYTRDEKGYA
jgi:hypothetical protein